MNCTYNARAKYNIIAEYPKPQTFSSAGESSRTMRHGYSMQDPKQEQDPDKEEENNFINKKCFINQKLRVGAFISEESVHAH